MNSTSIISVAWGNQYKVVIPRWWSYIEKIRIKPDEIVIAHHPDDDTGVQDLLKHKDFNIKLVECYERNYAKMANTAIAATTSEWFIPAGLDDFLYPNALDFQKIVRQDVDIVLASREVTHDNIFLSETDPNYVKKFRKLLGPTNSWHSLSEGFEDHRVFHNSPVRKSLWDRLGGYPDYIIADWAFFLLAWQQNVKVQHWGAITVLQYLNRNTLSQTEEAGLEIIALRKSMGLE